MTEGLIQVKLIRDLLKHIFPRVKTLCSTSQLEQTKQGASNMPEHSPVLRAARRDMPSWRGHPQHNLPKHEDQQTCQQSICLH